MSETRAARDARKERHREAMAGVRDMTDDQLKDLQHELGREKNQVSRAMQELNARLDAVRAERERRATATTRGFHISDHAVLRYLERIKGVDVAAVREEISALAEKQKLHRHEHQYAREDAGDGLIFGFNGVDKTVTTIMTPRENAVCETDGPHKRKAQGEPNGER